MTTYPGLWLNDLNMDLLYKYGNQYILKEQQQKK